MKVRRLALISLFVLGAPMAATEAQAQWGSRNVPSAYNEGYSRGVRAGEEDSRRGQSFDFRDENDYRRADLGYQRGYGNLDSYRNDFRRGFEEGYRTGYRSSGSVYNGPNGSVYNRGNGRGYGWGNARYDLAFSNGYSDGYDEGLNDGRKQHRNDPIAESRYRSGDHGYDRAYGSKDTYKLNYRGAFTDGYEQGYRDGLRYRNY